MQNSVNKKTQLSQPPTNWLLGCVPEFRRDALGTLMKYAMCGDVVKVPYGLIVDLVKRRRGTAAYLLNHPDDIKHVLVTNDRNYRRIEFPPAAKRVFGRGLIISEDPLHRKQRRMIQPYFHRQRIVSYAEIMVQKTRQHIQGWHDGATVNVAREMMQLTLSVACKAFFNMDLTDKTNELTQAVTVGQHHITRQFRSFTAMLTPEFIPTKNNVQFGKAIRKLDHTILGIIQTRRASGERPNDVLSMLLDARDEEDHPMSDQQVRDEALTLFLAGHDTTANALAWTCYLLAQHPEVEARLLDELKRVLNGQPPSAADVPKLIYTEMVFSEAIRLYPPAYLLSRTALGDDRFPCGVGIPAGADVWLCPYVIHRDSRFFPDPERFDPERFSEKSKKDRHPYAYFPFGGGSRMCIGESFAEMEGVLLIATIAQHFQMMLLPGQTIVPEPLVTLRPKNGILMQLSKRRVGHG